MPIVSAETTDAALLGRLLVDADPARALHAGVGAAAAAHGADIGYIFELDEHGEELRLAAATEDDGGWVGRFAFESGRGLSGWTAVNRAPARIDCDPVLDPRYFVSPDLPCEAFESILTLPLVGASGAVVGVLMLEALARHAFDDGVVVALEPLARTLAAVIESARLRTAQARQAAVVDALAGSSGRPLDEVGQARAQARLCHAAQHLLEASVALVVVRSAGSWRLVSCAADGAVVGHPERVVASPAVDELARLDLPGPVAPPLSASLSEAVGAPAGGWHAVPLGPAAERALLLCQPGRRATPDGLAGLSALAAQLDLLLRCGRLAARGDRRDPAAALVEALASGEGPAAVVRARARRIGIDLDQGHVVAVFEATAADSRRADPERALRLVRDELRGRFDATVCRIQGLAAEAVVRSDSPADVRTRLGQSLRAAGERGGVQLAVGISRVGLGVDSFPAVFDEAREAVRLGRALDGPWAVALADELGARRQLWALARNGADDELARRVERLADHDRRRRTQLVETLEALLDAGGNQTVAAARLGVHRNTLRQRAARIAAIGDLRLDDPGSRFDLEMAVRLARLRRLQAPVA